jgi:putative FmdB family regulatory protein
MAVARSGTMAVYEFSCQACGERFEVTAPMSEHERLTREPPACPACGKKETQQVVSLFSCRPASTF